MFHASKTKFPGTYNMTTVLVTAAGLVTLWSADLHAGVTFDATIDGVTYTIVETDVFRALGVAGNTVATSPAAPSDATLFWSNFNNTTDGLWWDRTSPALPNYVALGGTSSINVLNINTEAAVTIEVKTTVMGLDSGTYDVFSVYASEPQGENGGNFWSVTSDLGVTATTVHSADGTEPILVNDEVFERDIILDYLGTTDGGVTSFEVFTDAGDPNLGQRTYWIGVAYVKVAAAVALEIVSVDHEPGSREATVTWRSSEGTSYSVDASNDLLNWSELDDAVAGEAGDTTSFTEDFDAAPLPADVSRRYYRVRRNPN